MTDVTVPNGIAVSIPIWCDYKVRPYRDRAGVVMFQFQYGAIIRSFLVPCLSPFYWFQFQYGAIISGKYSGDGRVLYMFQFQYGAIIRIDFGTTDIPYQSFNSNMVRL